MSNNNNSGGMGLFSVLFVVFLVLKLTGTIDWAWIWIFSPIWGTIILFLIIFLIFAIDETIK